MPSQASFVGTPPCICLLLHPAVCLPTTLCTVVYRTLHTREVYPGVYTTLHTREVYPGVYLSYLTYPRGVPGCISLPPTYPRGVPGCISPSFSYPRGVPGCYSRFTVGQFSHPGVIPVSLLGSSPHPGVNTRFTVGVYSRFTVGILFLLLSRFTGGRIPTSLRLETLIMWQKLRIRHV